MTNPLIEAKIAELKEGLIDGGELEIYDVEKALQELYEAGIKENAIQITDTLLASLQTDTRMKDMLDKVRESGYQAGKWDGMKAHDAECKDQFQAGVTAERERSRNVILNTEITAKCLSHVPCGSCAFTVKDEIITALLHQEAKEE